MSDFIQRWGMQGGPKISCFVSDVNLFVSEIRLRMRGEFKISLRDPRDGQVLLRSSASC